MRMRYASWLMVLCAGCSSDRDGAIDGGRPDSGATTDDAAVIAEDGRVPTDAAEHDARGPSDGGVQSDGSAMADGGARDAGESSDAGTTKDAQDQDSSTVVDARAEAGGGSEGGTPSGPCKQRSDCPAGQVCVSPPMACSTQGGTCKPEVSCTSRTQCGADRCSASSGSDCHCFECPAGELCGENSGCYTCSPIP